MDGWTEGGYEPICHIFLLTMETSCVCFQHVACCQRWPCQWTHLGTGGSGVSEMAFSSPHQKPHHCYPQRRRGRATTWRGNGSCSPTMTYSTKNGQTSPRDTRATESAQPSTPSSPSCPGTSWSSFTGTLGQYSLELHPCHSENLRDTHYGPPFL